MWNLWDTLQSSTSLPLFLLQFRAPLTPSLSFSFFPSIGASSLSFLSKALSWWWSFSFHGLFFCRWCILSPLLIYLPLQLHAWKSPLKDLSEIQRSNLYRSFSNKFPSLSDRQASKMHSLMEELHYQVFSFAPNFIYSKLRADLAQVGFPRGF